MSFNSNNNTYYNNNSYIVIKNVMIICEIQNENVREYGGNTEEIWS